MTKAGWFREIDAPDVKEIEMKLHFFHAAIGLALLPTMAKAQTADANKQPTQSLSHEDPQKQKAQSLAHEDPQKQKAQSLSHADPAAGVNKQQ